MATVTIVVDGFSTDSTAKVAKEAGTTSMIEQSDRKIYGKGVAMKAGLAEAASRYCAVSRRIISPPEVIDDGYCNGNSIYDNTIGDATYAIKVYRADGNSFAENDIVSADSYEYYLVYGGIIKIEDQHFSNDAIYGASGTNKVTIEDSETIRINGGNTYNTNSSAYSKSLTNQLITMDTVG